MSEIEALKADIEYLEDEVSNLEDKIQEKDSEIADLEDEVYEIKNKLEDEVYEIKNKLEEAEWDLESYKKTASDIEEEHSDFVEALGKIIGIHRTSRFGVDPVNCILDEVKELMENRNAGN